MYAERYYYPAGTNLRDKHLLGYSTVASCYECGAEISGNECFYRFSDKRFCRECCTETAPEENDVCDYCGKEINRAEYIINGKTYCNKCVEIEVGE